MSHLGSKVHKLGSTFLLDQLSLGSKFWINSPWDQPSWDQLSWDQLSWDQLSGHQLGGEGRIGPSQNLFDTAVKFYLFFVGVTKGGEAPCRFPPRLFKKRPIIIEKTRRWATTCFTPLVSVAIGLNTEIKIELILWLNKS